MTRLASPVSSFPCFPLAKCSSNSSKLKLEVKEVDKFSCIRYWRMTCRISSHTQAVDCSAPISSKIRTSDSLISSYQGLDITITDSIFDIDDKARIVEESGGNTTFSDKSWAKAATMKLFPHQSLHISKDLFE